MVGNCGTGWESKLSTAVKPVAYKVVKQRKFFFKNKNDNGKTVEIANRKCTYENKRGLQVTAATTYGVINNTQPTI